MCEVLFATGRGARLGRICGGRPAANGRTSVARLVPRLLDLLGDLNIPEEMLGERAA